MSTSILGKLTETEKMALELFKVVLPTANKGYETTDLLESCFQTAELIETFVKDRRTRTGGAQDLSE